eukprot:TRINITY_DN30843_c0_g1_i1.p1 TRINITY_DN30843_c0_g1~~TRINITY_DN30843_c0_g1_i1.p1  ORF type:complete len:694 (-),score=107.48 TRINITY_DN30843_c0_g1_i1:163-2244(-)
MALSSAHSRAPVVCPGLLRSGLLVQRRLRADAAGVMTPKGDAWKQTPAESEYDRRFRSALAVLGGVGVYAIFAKPRRRSYLTLAAEAPSLEATELGDMTALQSRADHSWMRELVPDPETDKYVPNRTSRQVKAGHYVEVKPTPLQEPYLVTFSRSMAAELGLSEEACRSEDFLRFFSGDGDAAPTFSSWATPYALSIYGQEMYDNCPFRNGNGYGDGRAISVGEIVLSSGRRWEMQLKGAGPTPFCRGADGRAVLRSSIREFLASEAMHAMGVSTTRAISLIASRVETAGRPWYSNRERQKIDENFLTQISPKFVNATEEMKRMAIAQLKSQMRNPDVMQLEPCAITCRVAPSFLRVGHVDLHGRRARRFGDTERHHLQLIVEHALMREYSDVDDPSLPLQERTLRMASEFARRLSRLVADWLRVGYTQGNFNSDNCLVAGRTMDYGPFGFIEKYEPLWNMWVGGGEHFAFMNQPNAAQKNYETFMRSIEPLLDEAGIAEADRLVKEFGSVCRDACNDVWRRKLGLQSWNEECTDLFKTLERLLEKSEADWTLFWRQLAVVADEQTSSTEAISSFPEALRKAFYKDVATGLELSWLQWLNRWLALLRAGAADATTASDITPGQLMRQTSPKYVPREWMLVNAYGAAEQGNLLPLLELQELFTHPFDEQPQHEEFYYRRAPEESEDLGGTGYMS